MRDLNGVAALAAALLWIAYLVPHRLRHRQQLLESRAEDRFSGALRVLAVTDLNRPAARAHEARAECGLGTEKRSGLLTPGRGLPVQGHQAVARGGRTVDRPHGTQDKLSADAARRIAARRAQRAASLARRAAAARRRAALTAVLLLVSAVAWTVVGIASIAIVAAVVPTVALVGVLVLGRRAVVHGHATDAAWDRQRHPAGGLLVAGKAGLTQPVRGMAYHPSDSMTEVIARVRDDAPAAAADLDPAAAGPDVSLAGAPARVDAAETTPVEHTDWVPVPVPRPVYTTKAEAPRREPIPLVLDDPEVAAAVATATTSSAGEEEQGDRAEPDGPADLESAGSTPNPTLDLDAILARRRNVG